jgi:DNA-binding response OmpR family regulator
MAKILVVEDDQLIADSLADLLRADSHLVDVASDGTIAFDFLEATEFDVMILDWQLPKITGIEVCRKYRASGGQTPIIMLTAMNRVEDKVEGLDCGADDYLTKPFDVRELRARIKALIRRPVTFAGEQISAGPITINTKSRSVSKSGVDVHFQPHEYMVLEYLMRHPNEVVSVETLLAKVWSTDSDVSMDAVYTCVKRIRKKIDTKPKDSMIRTVHGIGYRLIPSAPEDAS